MLFLNSVHKVQDIAPWVKRDVKQHITMGLLSFVYRLFLCMGFNNKIKKTDIITRFKMAAIKYISRAF